jgi:dihydrofolate reductase
MGKLIVYNFISLNGYFKGVNEDISWAKSDSKGEKDFAAEKLRSGNILLFGRKTYELMAGYWPTPEAAKNNPHVADGMNQAEKIVFSRSIKTTDWNNTQIMRGELEDQIKKLKSGNKDITILGSGTLVDQLTDEKLIDEYQIMEHPVIIAGGTPIFSGVKNKHELKLIETKNFDSGVVLITYQPVK